jgi:hypothetical protein
MSIKIDTPPLLYKNIEVSALDAEKPRD